MWTWKKCGDSLKRWKKGNQETTLEIDTVNLRGNLDGLRMEQKRQMPEIKN